jgi:NitT/TauT family transport system substrate-binding protein
LLLALTLAAGADAAEGTSLRLILDHTFQGPAAPFLLPLDRGYFQAEGLNVAIDPAAEPLDLLQPIKLVAAGTYEMGVADINALIRFRDANPEAPVKAVFVVYNRPAYAIIGRKSRGIAVPKDLEGKKLGAPPTDPASAQWPIFAKTSDIDLSKVRVENLSLPVREPMLAAGQVDAITGLTFSSFINLKDRGVPVDDIVVLRMADYGLALYGSAIIVNTKFAAAHPDAVAAFLRAFLKGLKQTIAAPAAAIDVVLRQNDALKKDLELERLRMVIRDNIVTPEVKANGYGTIDPARFTRAIEQIALAYRFKEDRPKPEDIFDGSFLPPPDARPVR